MELCIFRSPHQCGGQRLFPQQQGQSAAPEEGALTQILSTEPLQRENFSSFLCLLLPPTSLCILFCFTAHILSSLSFHPAAFIILSSLDHSLQSSIISASFFSLSLYLSLALTSLQHCSVGKDASTHFLSFFLPTCKVYNKPKGFILSRQNTHTSTPVVCKTPEHHM